MHLWQRTVELVDGVHHVQQHVVAHDKLPLHVRRKRVNKYKTKKNQRRHTCQWSAAERTDWEMAWMTLEKPTASFSSSCSQQTRSQANREAPQQNLSQSFAALTCSLSSFCCSRLFLSSSSTLLTWINRSFCAHTHTHTYVSFIFFTTEDIFAEIHVFTFWVSTVSTWSPLGNLVQGRQIRDFSYKSTSSSTCITPATHFQFSVW